MNGQVRGSRRAKIAVAAATALVLGGLLAAQPAAALTRSTAEVCANPDCHAWGPGPDPSLQPSVPPAVPAPVTDPAPVAAPVASAPSATAPAVTPPAAATPLALGRPSAAGRVFSARRFAVSGTLSAAHDSATTVVLEFSRKSGHSYRSGRRVTVTVAPGSTSYRTSLTLKQRGVWRVRAVHSDSVHSRSVSAARGFRVR